MANLDSREQVQVIDTTWLAERLEINRDAAGRVLRQWVRRPGHFCSSIDGSYALWYPTDEGHADWLAGDDAVRAAERQRQSHEAERANYKDRREDNFKYLWGEAAAKRQADLEASPHYAAGRAALAAFVDECMPNPLPQPARFVARRTP